MKSKILNNIDFETVNILLEGFNKLTGFVTAIEDLEGNVLSKSGWREICSDFHRKHPETAKKCKISDIELTKEIKTDQKYHFYKCMNGLVDVVVPIVINDEHIANLFTGQFFFELPDVSFFRKQAEIYGFDEKAYLEALSKVPVFTREKAEEVLDFLLNITQIIVKMTQEKIYQMEINEEIKKSEMLFKENEAKLEQNLQDLLESQRIAHLGTWRLNLATNHVVWSEELYKMYGFDSTIPPPPYTEHMKLFTSESWDKLSTSLERTRTSGIPYELELETVTKDGSNGWMWVRGEAEKDSDRNIVSLRGAAQDITERKKMEHQIKQSEERFQLLFNKAPLGYQSLDFEGCFIDVNQKWLETLGYSKEEVIGKWFGDFLCPEYVEGFRQRFPIFKAQGYIHSEFEMLTKDGQRLFIAFDGKVGYNVEGEFKQTHCILQDITDQRRTEKALIESEEKHRLLITQMTQGIAVHEVVLNEVGDVIDYCFIDSNQAFERLTGLKREDIIGRKVREVMPTIEHSWIQKYGHVAMTGEPLFFEDYSKVLGKHFEVVAYSPKPKQFATIFSDITERKKVENELLHLSYHDHLTELYNRRYFEEELKKIDRQENLPISIIMCDINGLKMVNDSFGHNSGDELLNKAARTIKKACREEDIIARIGGDEFIVLLPNTTASESTQIANHIKELASNEKVANIELSISYGYDTKTDDKQSIVEIISNAENHMYRHKLHERSSMRSKTIDLIMNTLFEKSNRELLHSNRVSAICKAIATKMNLDKDVINQLGIAGLIHDIGKIGIDEKILNKDGMLTDDERKDIEKHPEIGWRLLSSTDEFSELGQIVLAHHEKWDGSGYPNGLKDITIPLEARILVIADAYDAMTNERTYRKEMSNEEAIKEIKRCSGTHFDPNIVDVFVHQVLLDSNNFRSGS
ncbi:MAG: PocR ligand-binding domain-containing protein [Eubacteriales bacterium]|nr:PocR ligand-binding domain-containing protein [Eubacteriales bacterium]